MDFSKKRLQAYQLLLLNTLIWGAAFVVIKPAFEVTTPFRFLFLRFGLAALLSIPIVWHYWKKRQWNLKDTLIIICLELLGTTIGLSLVYLGLARTSALEANLIGTTAPLFLVLVSVFFLKERQERYEWTGFSVTFLGTLVITLLPIVTHGQISWYTSLIGNLLILAANLTDSVYLASAKRLYRRLPKLLVTAISFWVGMVSFGVLAWWQAEWALPELFNLFLNDLTATSVQFAVLYMATLGSIVALSAYIKAQDNIEASEASIFRYLQPLVYIPLAIIFLKEPFTIVHFSGLVLIFSGVLISLHRNRKKRQNPVARFLKKQFLKKQDKPLFLKK